MVLSNFEASILYELGPAEPSASDFIAQYPGVLQA